MRKGTAAAFSLANVRRYFGTALKHAQELAQHVSAAAAVKGGARGGVEIQEQVEMMLLDVFLGALGGRLAHLDSVPDAYRSRSATLGRRVAVDLGAGRGLEGEAVAVADSGSLVVRTDEHDFL